MSWGNLIRCASVLVLLASCSQPSSYESFVTIDKSRGGVYSFDLDMSDSLATYDIWLFNRVIAPCGHNEVLEDIPVEILWEGADSTSYAESVYMKSGGSKGNKQLYRSGVMLAKPGMVKLQIRPQRVPEGFSGVGVVCERKYNGTR